MVDPANVPDVDGVPPLLGGFAAGFDQGIDLLTEDTLSYFTGQFGPQWGIFQNGEPVVVADSVVAFEYKQEWSISDYPVEQGGFQSYNKVSLPFSARLRFSTGGSASDRTAFLNSIAAIAGTTDIYEAATPEVTYPSCNVMHYDYKRTAVNGAGLLQVDVWLLEIRQTASATLGNTQTANAASQTNSGTVQTTTPTATQAQAASGATTSGTQVEGVTFDPN